MKESIEAWRHVWRVGFAPQLSTAALEAVRDGLVNDDPAMLQGRTTEPPPLACVRDFPACGACLVGYAGWKAENLATVGEVEEFFARTCFVADERLQESAGCRFFLNWFDETPRGEVIAALLPEVERSLAMRSAVASG